MNLNLRDFRINTQAILIMGGFLLLALINFFTLRNYINDIEEDALILKSTTENKWVYEKIEHYLRRYKNGEENLEFPISQLASRYSSTVETLNIGGILPNSDAYIDPLKGDVKYSAGKIRMYWGEQLDRINTFLYPGTQIDSLNANKPKSPESAFSQFMLNSDYFQKTNEELVKGLMLAHEAKQSKLDNVLLFFLILNIFCVGLLTYAVTKYFFKPLDQLAELSHKVSQGELSENSEYLKDNELGNISRALNKLIDNLRNATSFVREIGQGNLNKEFEGIDISTTKEGSLEASLLNMRTEMREMDEAEQERKWTTEGLAKFVDILRSTDSNVQALSGTIISNLIDYTKSNQGAIYLVNKDDEDDHYLEQVALYAFDTQKFEEKKIRLGEGLVGQTYLEQKTTYLLEVPHNYVTIVSGLGGANPKSILLVPLMVNDEIYGVIELASFNEYKPHEIEFVEKLAESISSTISGVKNNELTRHLLEESQELTEQMQSQEEEMRQNMEELTATQEEMNRKARETEVLLEESQKRSKYIEVLVQIAKYDFENRDSLLSYSINVIGDLLGWPVAHVYLTQKEGDQTVLVPSKIWKGEQSQEFNIFKSASEKTNFAPGVGLPGTVYNQRTSNWIDDIIKEPNFPRASHAAALNLHSAFGTPIMIDGEVTGVIEFFTKEAVESDEHLMDFMNQVGDLIGSLIKRLHHVGNIEEYDELKEVEEELRQNLEALEITQKQLDSRFMASEYKLNLMDDTLGLISCDSQGNITEMNAKALSVFDIEISQVTNKNIKELINNYDAKFLVTEGDKEVEINSADGQSNNFNLKVQFSRSNDTPNQVHLVWL